MYELRLLLSPSPGSCWSILQLTWEQGNSLPGSLDQDGKGLNSAIKIQFLKCIYLPRLNGAGLGAIALRGYGRTAGTVCIHGNSREISLGGIYVRLGVKRQGRNDWHEEKWVTDRMDAHTEHVHESADLLGRRDEANDHQTPLTNKHWLPNTDHRLPSADH